MHTHFLIFDNQNDDLDNQNDKQNNSYFKKNFVLIKLLPTEFDLISFLYNCYPPPSHEFQKIFSPQKFGPRIATGSFNI